MVSAHELGRAATEDLDREEAMVLKGSRKRKSDLCTDPPTSGTVSTEGLRAAAALRDSILEVLEVLAKCPCDYNGLVLAWFVVS